MNIAAQHGRDVDQRGIGAVNAVGGVVAEKEVLGQIEDQDGAHPVIGEALPHFREEQHVQPARVAEEGFAFVRCSDGV